LAQRQLVGACVQLIAAIRAWPRRCAGDIRCCDDGSCMQRVMDPSHDGRTCQRQAMAGHHLDQIAQAQFELRVPAHAQIDDLAVKVSPRTGLSIRTHSRFTVTAHAPRSSCCSDEQANT
jgi:hypothetical protein